VPLRSGGYTHHFALRYSTAPPPGLTRGSTNSFRLFMDGRIKSGHGVEF
jgi:hypothetical protein